MGRQSPVSTSSRPPSSAGRVFAWPLNKRVGCLPWSLNSPSAAQKSRRRRRSSESLCVSLLGLRPTARKLQSPNRNWFIFVFSSCAKQFSDQRSVPPAGLHCPQTVWWQAEGVLVAAGVHVAEGVHEAAGSPGADATRSWSVHVVVTQSELLKFFLFLFPSFSFSLYFFFVFLFFCVCNNWISRRATNEEVELGFGAFGFQMSPRESEQLSSRSSWDFSFSGKWTSNVKGCFKWRDRPLIRGRCHWLTRSSGSRTLQNRNKLFVCWRGGKNEIQ